METLLYSIQTGNQKLGNSCPYMSVLLYFRSDLAFQDSRRFHEFTGMLKKTGHFFSIFRDVTFIRILFEVWIEVKFPCGLMAPELLEGTLFHFWSAEFVPGDEVWFWGSEYEQLCLSHWDLKLRQRKDQLPWCGHLFFCRCIVIIDILKWYASAGHLYKIESSLNRKENSVRRMFWTFDP